MTTNAMEMRRDIIGYVETHSPVELPLDVDTARELGRLAGHPLGSEPELEYLTAEAVQTLQTEGHIATTEKDDALLVEYTAPLEPAEKHVISVYNEILSPYDRVEADCIAIESIHAQLTTQEDISDDRAHELLRHLLTTLDRTHDDLNNMI
jgi:hypothetical protein